MKESMTLEELKDFVKQNPDIQIRIVFDSSEERNDNSE